MTITKFHVEPAFEDARGVISNILAVPIQHVAIITSKKGSVRGNHLHKRDAHWTYILSGLVLYYEQDHSGVEDRDQARLLPGDLVFTRRNQPHAFYYLEDTTMLTFSTMGLRTGEDYQKDTVHVPLCYSAYGP